jgi:hypothetical protein
MAPSGSMELEAEPGAAAAAEQFATEGGGEAESVSRASLPVPGTRAGGESRADLWSEVGALPLPLDGSLTTATETALVNGGDSTLLDAPSARLLGGIDDETTSSSSSAEAFALEESIGGMREQSSLADDLDGSDVEALLSLQGIRAGTARGSGDVGVVWGQGLGGERGHVSSARGREDPRSYASAENKMAVADEEWKAAEMGGQGMEIGPHQEAEGECDL